MREFTLTSEMFTGEVRFVFAENGLLHSFDFSSSGVSEVQQVAILQRLPQKVEDIYQLTPPGSSGKITEVFREVTFAEFWALYFKNRYKDNSSKKTAEKRWNNMSKGAQLAACNYIGQYFLNIPAGTQPKLAETYLSSEVWVK